jgi:hypothetical protein
MKHGIFELDELTFVGIYNPDERWNGFFCPYFSLNESRRILFTQAPKSECIENEYYYYELSTCLNYLISYTPEGIDVFESITYKGDKYYPIGFCNWVWTLQK